jgi:hypothetical protein
LSQPFLAAYRDNVRLSTIVVHNCSIERAARPSVNERGQQTDTYRTELANPVPFTTESWWQQKFVLANRNLETVVFRPHQKLPLSDEFVEPTERLALLVGHW